MHLARERLRGYRGNRNRLRPSRSRSPLPGHARFADKAPRDARKESGAGRGIAGCCGRWRTWQASFSFPPVRLPHPRIESDAPARGRTCTSVRPSRLPLPPVRECFVRSPSPRHYDIARILPARSGFASVTSWESLWQVRQARSPSALWMLPDTREASSVWQVKQSNSEP